MSDEPTTQDEPTPPQPEQGDGGTSDDDRQPDDTGADGTLCDRDHPA
jgi:hypothetical protein